MIFRYSNINIYVDVKGEENQKSIIFLHGWGCDNTIFAQFSTLLAEKYKVFVFDFPGFGSSDEPQDAWGVEEYTAMVEKFVEEQKIENPSLIAHSFGGRVSLLYSSRNSVDKMVLTGCAGIVPKRSLNYYFKVYSFKTAKWFCNTFLSKERAKTIIDSYRKGAGSADYNSASPRMRQILSKVVNQDLKFCLPKIKSSVLLFWGENDTATPLRDGELIERKIKDCGLVKVKGGSHFAFIENRALFCSVLQSFFNL